MPCEQCPLFERCIERRGLCHDYLRYTERVERIRKEIEMLNKAQKSAIGAEADKVSKGIHEVGNERAEEV